MNKAIISFWLFFIIAVRAHGQVVHTTSADSLNPYGKYYQKPQFVGGTDSLDSFIKKNMRYPYAARESNIEGRVIVRFIVNEEGDISDATVIRSIQFSCDEEALRLVKAMPRWQPATYKHKPVKAVEVLPVIFKLQ